MPSSDYCSWILVFFVSLLITYIPISAQLFVFADHIPFNPSSVSSILFYLLFDTSVLSIWLNFYWACTLDPGGVPSGWDPSILPSGSVVELKQSTTHPRFCRNCNCFKPPRSHHCSACNRCILKMDHHCNFINNCVGFYNQPYFVRFLLFVDIAVVFCVVTLVSYVYKQINAPYPYWFYNDAGFIRMVVAVFDLILAIPILFMVGGLSLYHFWYILTNSTTIESMEKDRKALVLRTDGLIGNVQNPYQHSFMYNVVSVFGPNPILWLLPVGKPPGDGTAFAVNQNANWEFLQEPVAVPPRTLARSAHYHRKGPDQYLVDVRNSHPYAGYVPSTSPLPSLRFRHPQLSPVSSHRPSACELTDSDDDTPLIETQRLLHMNAALKSAPAPLYTNSI